MTPLISVITPCFNHGRYLDDACNSIRNNDHKMFFEHIIVNDGSTDADTLHKLRQLESEGYTVVHQANSGLANARNAGIRLAKGKYILPLDSDNKIIPDVMLKALKLLETDENLDVVYTDSYLFGEMKTVFKTGEFDLLKLLYDNYIDACALIRKETLLRLGSYDHNIPYMGHEDWDLWINIALNNGKFYYLQEVGYCYRVVKNSMVRTVTYNKQAENRSYIFKKHAATIPEYYVKLYEKEADLLQMNRYIKKNRIKAIIKLLFNRSLIK